MDLELIHEVCQNQFCVLRLATIYFKIFLKIPFKKRFIQKYRKTKMFFYLEIQIKYFLGAEYLLILDTRSKNMYVVLELTI